MASPEKVVVAGGGIIGIASAFYLRQAGVEVTLIDQGKLGAACSHGNCGFISPSHIFPLCNPAALKQGFKAFLQKNGPLKIAPGLNWSLWKWLLQFASHCNERDMLEIGHARHAILQSSRKLYLQLIEEQKLDCEWQPKGCLFVYADKSSYDAHAHRVAQMEQEYGVKFQGLVGAELEAFEPALIPGSAYGAWYFADDVHLRPSKLAHSWGQVLRNQGVTILEDCPFEAFVAEGNRIRGVKTSQGEIAADAVVIAMGALTPFLNQQLGYQVPIQPGKGYSITMSCPEICPERPMIFEKEKVAITPMKSAFRVGSTMELAGYDKTLNRARLDLLRRGASRYLKQPAGKVVEEEWFGWRPMTPDGKPIIDFSPKYRNVLVAAGHNMLGVSMAPATGKLVSEILTDQPRHIDPQPFLYPRKKAVSKSTAVTTKQNRVLVKN